MYRFTARIITTLGLMFCLGCGQSPSQSSAGGNAADICFGLTGTYTQGGATLGIGNSGQYQYCRGYSNRCGQDFYLISQNSDGGFYVKTDPSVLPAHADCLSAQYQDCRMDVSGANLTMDCGTAFVY